MPETTAIRPSITAFSAAALAGAILAVPNYDMVGPTYEIKQVRGTYSAFIANAKRDVAMPSDFAKQVSDLFGEFAAKQERLGVEFEAAIFSDIESLYEA